MPKVVECPITRWPGTVTLKDPIPMPDCIKIERAIRQRDKWVEDNYEPTRTEADEAFLPCILACVERFDLGNGFTSDPFPGSPKKSSAMLVAWLFTEIVKVYLDEGEGAVPLA